MEHFREELGGRIHAAIMVALLCGGCAGSLGTNLPPGMGEDAAAPPDSLPWPDAGAQGPRQDGQVSPDSGQTLSVVGARCSTGAQCQSGHCADGYCCDRACAGVCQVCDVKGAEGLCTPTPRGKDPANDCPGEAGCGNDVCDGLGACMAPRGKGVLCKASCSSSNLYLNEQYCDGAGRCAGTATTRLCSPFTCGAAPGGGLDVCGKGCKTHGECAVGSACDRSAAHKTGFGVCVATAKVQAAATDKELFDALLAVEKGVSSKTHILLTGKAYKGGLFIKGSRVTILGMGAAQTTFVDRWSLPAFTVHAGGDLTLQGVKISGAKYLGLVCDDLVVSSRLTLLESVVDGSGNTGVFAGGNCLAELRRNRITNNKAGGVRLYGGGVAVNNVITGNGSATSSIGGGYLVGDLQGRFTFSNNTVSDNLAQQSMDAGIRCRRIHHNLENNVIWNTGYSKSLVVTSACTFSHSLVQGLAAGTGCINSAPGLDAAYRPCAKSPCIDAGAPTSVTAIDIMGQPRPGAAGGKVDLGAFEVK